MIRNTPIFGLLTLLAVALAAPALTGMYLAREFDGVVARFDRPGATHVVSSRFRRGWFESEARIRVRLADALCAEAPCPAVTVHSTLHHGPIPFTAPIAADAGLRPALGIAETRIDAATLWPGMAFEPALEPLRLTTRVGFDGRAVSRLEADGTTLDITRGQPVAHVEMSPLSARAAVSLRGAGIDGNLDWPRFKFLDEAGGQLAWRGLSVTSRRGNGTAPATQRLRADSLRMTNDNDRSALLTGVDWKLHPVSSATGAGGIRLDARIAHVVLDNREYGALRMQGRFADIDLAAWVAMGRDLAAGNNASASTAPYQDKLVELMATHPRIDIEQLRVNAPAGDIRGHLRVSVPEDLPSGRLLADNIARLELDFSLRLPETITRDITVQAMLDNGWSPYELDTADVDRALTQLIDRGLIEQINGGDTYRLRLRIHAGRLALNGVNQPGWQAVVDRFEAARAQL